MKADTATVQLKELTVHSFPLWEHRDNDLTINALGRMAGSSLPVPERQLKG